MSSKSRISPVSITIAFLGLCALALAAYLAFGREGAGVVPKNISESFINPVAALVQDENLSLGGRIALKSELEEMAQENIARGVISDYGIYYRELISGPVIALKERGGFFPASLLKIPVAMWYFKQAETMPGLLDEEVDFLGPPGTSIGHFLPKNTIQAGNRYTIRELIRFMLAESDNDATHILTEYAGGREVINSIYADLGIRDVEDSNTYVIDTQTYVAFFRVLYNAEYLDDAASAELLSILAESTFTEGLTARLPSATVVAHKFGERTVREGVNQLHDCGVIYAPQNPYLLCVMTQGDDYDEMARFIADVSYRIYNAATNDSF